MNNKMKTKNQTMRLLCCGIVAGSLLMTGCNADGSANNQDIGTITGGVIGGLIGSQFGAGTGQIAAAAGGAVVGAFLGNKIGASMDKTDQLATQQALDTSKPKTWESRNGNTYTVTPKKTYTKNNQTCREYTTTATIDGKAETIKGTACRQSDGTWKAT